ncbi:MAG: glycosyltransferase family 4 protein [Kiritimatiellae bacterium]|nr:glycosyltransferase family 4 protein [Kiritimatiellia bacterium]
MKVAVASSGLGHVARGIETWARDTAAGLHEAGADVTLFAGARTEDAGSQGQGRATSPNVGGAVRTVVVGCVQRGAPRAGRLARLTPRWAWRSGLRTTYGWEQFTFWWRLWPKLRRGRFDILHVQDPMLAFWCRAFRRWGLLRTREILAHGTEEPPEFIAGFECVQHLAPWHLEQALEACRAEGAAGKSNVAACGSQVEDGKSRTGAGSAGRVASIRPYWVAIPNFVDCDLFRPAASAAERRHARERFGIPVDAYVIGAVAAVKRPHKRIDYLIREFAEFRSGVEDGKSQVQGRRSNAGSGESVEGKAEEPAEPFLVIAGARTEQSEDLVRMAESLVPGRMAVLFDMPREDMPVLYRAMDVFVLASLFEMMPIAVLEAIASGLPVLANGHPVLEWMLGGGPGDGAPAEAGEQAPLEAGRCIDMAAPGALARALRELPPEALAAYRPRARQRAQRLFSKQAVVQQCLAYYRQVCPEHDHSTAGADCRPTSGGGAT